MRSRERPLKVLLVMEATYGGTGRYLRQVTLGLLGRGVEVEVVCSARRFPAFAEVMEEMRAAGAGVTEIDMRREVRPIRDALAILRLRRVFRRLDPDVIHLHSSKAGALGRVAAAATRSAPVAYSPHAYAFLDRTSRWRSSLYLLVEKALGGLTHRLVAVSESEGRLTVEHALVPQDKVAVVRNGVEVSTATCHAAFQEQRGSARRPVRLGSLGRLERQKAPLRLLGLASELRQQGIAFTLDIAGSGSLLEECRHACRTRGLLDCIRFRPSEIEPEGFHASIDVFIIPSTYEGLPYSVLDAMASRLPVVGFDVVGVNDLVVPGTTGFLASPFRIDEMARHVSRLASDPELRRSMGRMAAERVRTHFRFDRQIEELIAVYRSLAPRRASSRRQRPEGPLQ